MMRPISSCTEISTRPVPAHVSTTDVLPGKMHKPGRPRPISHTQTPRLPIKTVRHRSNMTFIFVFTFWMLTKAKRTVYTMPSVPHTKMNENKEITPTKYTRNPPDHRHRRQITILPPQTLLPDFIRWSHAILMVPVLLAHMFVLSYQ